MLRRQDHFLESKKKKVEYLIASLKKLKGGRLSVIQIGMVSGRSGSCISSTVLIEGRYNAVERRSPFVLSAIVNVNFVPCTVKPDTRIF